MSANQPATLPALAARRGALPASVVPVMLAVLLTGCAASGSPAYDSVFGDASRVLRAQQTIDPDAPTKNAGITPPTDGRTMREAIDRQVDTFRQPPATNIINIGVGAGGNGS